MSQATMRAIFALLVVTSVSVGNISACLLLKILPKLPICSDHHDSVSIKNCIAESIEWLTPQLDHGVPGLNIQSYNPYVINEVYDMYSRTTHNNGTLNNLLKTKWTTPQSEHGTSDLNKQSYNPHISNEDYDMNSKTTYHKGTWKNYLKINGLMNYRIYDVKIPYNQSLEFRVRLPVLYIFAKSSIDLKIFHISMLTESTVNLIVANVTAYVKMSGKYYTNVFGERYFNVTEVYVALAYRNIDVTFGKKYPRNNLRESFNVVVRNNVKTVVNRIMYYIDRNAGNVIQDLANKIFSSCTARKLLRNIPYFD